VLIEELASAVERGTVYQKSVEEQIKKLSSLMRQRRKLDVEISRLQTLARTQALLRLGVPDSSSSPSENHKEKSIGFTAAVRQVLFTYRVWLTPGLVRDLLPSVGLEPSHQKHELSSVHTVLKRLVRNGTAVRQLMFHKVMYRGAEAGAETDLGPASDN
jgi:hypothetical protein